jgi:hypothetical protein
MMLSFTLAIIMQPIENDLYKTMHWGFFAFVCTLLCVAEFIVGRSESRQSRADHHDCRAIDSELELELQVDRHCHRPAGILKTSTTILMPARDSCQHRVLETGVPQ